MKHYVRLNVGLEETNLCIVDSAAIRSAIEGFADWLSHVGVAASSLGMWLHRELHPSGLSIIVVEDRHMRVSLSTMRNKTDRNDARGIAQMMRLGWFRAVHVKNVEMKKNVHAFGQSQLLKRKLVDIENYIRGALRTYALLVGAIGRSGFEARVRELIEHADYVFSAMIEAMQDGRSLMVTKRLHRMVLWPDAQATSVWIGGLRGTDYQTRRCPRPGGALRGGR